MAFRLRKPKESARLTSRLDSERSITIDFSGSQVRKNDPPYRLPFPGNLDASSSSGMNMKTLHRKPTLDESVSSVAWTESSHSNSPCNSSSQDDVLSPLAPASSKFAQQAAKALHSSSSSLSTPSDLVYKRMQEGKKFTRNKLHLSELVGRDNEVLTLKSVFGDLKSSLDVPEDKRPSFFVNVSGTSGTGKTVVAKQLISEAERSGGFFCWGKFDLTQDLTQHERAAPYTAFASAFRRLTRDINAHADAAIIKEEIRNLVGADSKVLLDVMPGLAPLFVTSDSGRNKGDGHTNIEQRSTQVHSVVRKLIRAVVDGKRPLVLLLDDVQWADPQSLDLAEALLMDPESSFLLVTTVRCNEITERHWFVQKLETLQRHKAVFIEQIILEDLDPSDIQKVVANALRSSVEHIQSLSDIVYSKTGGNPFVVLEFLKNLVDEGHLQYNMALLSWRWDEEVIGNLSVKDINVADLLATKIQRLPANSQFFLQVAACLGTELEEDILHLALMHLIQTNLFEVDQLTFDWEGAFKRCVDDGLLEKVGLRYTFAHDQVQAAAFRLIPEGVVPRLQVEVGRRLLQTPPEGVEEDRLLFMAVDLYNGGSSLVQGPEKIEVAQYNLQAGERAIAKSAFASALRYLESGLKMLEGSGAVVDSSLTDMSLAELEAVVDEKELPDQVRICRSRMVELGAQERFGEAIDTALMILRIYSRQVNVSNHTDFQNVVRELQRIQALRSRFLKIQSDADEMTSDERLMARAMVDQKNESAFNSAILFLDSCLKSLKDDGDDALTKLRLQLSIAVSEATYCVGDFENMERHMNNAIAMTGSFEDKLRMYRTRMVAFGAQERFRDAISTGLFILRELGMANNISDNPNSVALAKELKHTQMLLKKYDSTTISQLPILCNNQRILAMGIIHKMATFAYLSRPNLFMILYLKAVRWSVKYGLCKYSPAAFAVYGRILAGVVGDHKAASSIGDMALTMSEKFDSRDTLSATSLSVFGYVEHWTSDMRDAAKPLLYGYQVGMETGDVEVGLLNLYTHDLSLYVSGARKLEDLMPHLAVHVDLMREYKHHAMANMQALTLQTVLNVMGRSSNPLVLTGHAIQEEIMSDIAKDTDNAVMFGVMESWLTQLAVLFDDHTGALKHAERASGVGTKFHQGGILVARHMFFKALAHLSLAQSKKQSFRHVQVAGDIIKTFKKWVAAGNPNIAHCLKLLEAEMAFCKKKSSAPNLFGEAIALAETAGWNHDKALAHARAASFHLQVDHRQWAAFHLDKAIAAYVEWGASGVVLHLVRKHKDLLKTSGQISELTSHIIQQEARKA